MTMLTFHVIGTPGAQGSKRHVGGGRLIEMSKKVAPWRKAVHDAARNAIDTCDLFPGQPWQPLEGPIHASVTFFLTRPKSHWRTGRNAHLLRDNAPARPTSRAHGDIDKLIRSTLDALTQAGVIADDSLVVQLTTEKVWGLDGSGAEITVRAIADTEAGAA